MVTRDPPTDSGPYARLAPARWLSIHWLWLALFAAAFAPTAMWLWHRWTISIWYNGHGLFVPLIVAYLVWDHFQEQPLERAEPGSAWGLLLLGAGVAMLALDAAIHTQLLAAAGLVVCLPGLALLLLGVRRTRALAFPLILTPFMLPIPAFLVAPVHLALRHVTAAGSELLVELWGIPVLRQGTTLLLPHHSIEVAEACSGFSTLYAAITLSLILSYQSRSSLQRVLLLALSPILAVIANTIRVFILTLIVVYYGADPLRTPLHATSGIITFVIVLIGLFLVARSRRFSAISA